MTPISTIEGANDHQPNSIAVASSKVSPIFLELFSDTESQRPSTPYSTSSTVYSSDGSSSSKTTLVAKIRDKLSIGYQDRLVTIPHAEGLSFSLHKSIAFAAIIPASSAVFLVLALFGHLLIFGFGGDAQKLPIAGSVASGAVGGAVWGVIVLAIYGPLYWKGADPKRLESVACLLALLSVFIAPVIGFVIMEHPFHGRTMGPVLGMTVSFVVAFSIGAWGTFFWYMFACAFTAIRRRRP